MAKKISKRRMYNIGGALAPQWNIQSPNVSKLTSPVGPMKGNLGDLFGGVGGAIKKGLTSPIGTGIAGGVASVASNAISGGMSTGVGSAMQTLGGIASNIPGIGGLIGAGVNVLGGVVNRAFGSQINDQFVADTKAAANEQAAQQFDSSSIESVLAQQGNYNDMNLVSRGDVGKDGWFSDKAKNLTKSLNQQISFANKYNKDKLNTAFSNADESEDLSLLANFSAYGGPLLFKHGGGIHIKKANEGKFTEYCGGKVTSACISKGKHSSSPAVRKRATFADNARGWHHAFGGWLNSQGGDFTNGITFVGEGGTHEQNPNEGVQMGVDEQGIPNLVEEGEVIFNDYVFSNRTKLPKKVKKNLKLRGETFADAAKQVQKISEERPNDPISNRTVNIGMAKLAEAQEVIRQRKASRSNRFDEGGPFGLEQSFNLPNYTNQNRLAMSFLNKNPMAYMGSKGDIVAPEIPSTTSQQSSTSDKGDNLAPTWMRYAPVVGAGLGVISDAFRDTDYSDADRISSSYGSTPPVGFTPVSNRLTYNPLDTNYMINRLDANTAAQRRALLDTSGGNRATAMAGLIASDYNYGNQMGDLFRQAQEYNQQQRERVEGFNRQTNMYNSEGRFRADAANQQSRQADNERRLRAASAAAQMRQSISNTDRARRDANITGLLQGLGDIGYENFNMNMVNANPALYRGVNSDGSSYYKGSNKKKKGGRIVR